MNNNTIPTLDYKVIITTSGLGQQLGELTKYTNKSLVRVGKKPTLSYIIESYPKDIELVITVRHFADLVKEFVRLAYPDRKIIFSEEPQDAPAGTSFSLGYSLLQAKKYVTGPFIFHAGDTIVSGNVPEPKENWIGGFKGGSTASYRSFTARGGKVTHMHEKGALDFDYIHVGLVGVKDAEMFWSALKEMLEKNPSAADIGDVQVLSKLLSDGVSFSVQEFSNWFDTGNAEGLSKARKQIADHMDNLEKVDESIFLFDDFVLKFFADSNVVSHRVERANYLKQLVPPLQGSGKNFYRYEYVPGELYARAVNPTNFSHFLEWTENNLWTPVKEVDDEAFFKVCHDFYYDKTQKRVKKLLEDNNLLDQESVINGELVPSYKDLIDKVDFNWLCKADHYQFHGDFILDNIIKTETGYVLLDWRQNFGGLKKSGDKYYDLAKLNHNLSVNHDIIHQNLFRVDVEGEKVTVDVLRPDNLVQCQKVLERFLRNHNYDIQKVRVLTSIIWLNMSPLHHHPFNLFLYYFGKLNLWRAINQN